MIQTHSSLETFTEVDKHFSLRKRTKTFEINAFGGIGFHSFQTNIPAGVYMVKVNNRNARRRCEICSKLTTKTPARGQWRRSGVFIVNFEHMLHLLLVSLLLTLIM